MEKTLFFRRLIPFRPGYRSGAGGFRFVRISAFKITNQRIKGTLFGITMFEELIPEIAILKITPCFAGVQIEIKLRAAGRRAYYFDLPELSNLTDVLRKLNIKFECDAAVQERELRRNRFNHNPIVKIAAILLGVSFLIFLFYNIFLSVKR